MVRAEIQAAVAPLESRLGNLQSSVDGRLSQVEGMIKTHDLRIGKVEGALDNFLVNGKTMDETTATQVAQIESQLSDLKVQVDAMKVPTHTTASPSHTDTKCTMVVGGLAGLKTLPAASKWLTDTLESLHGPIHTGVYVKSEDFNGLMFAKFRSQLDCDTAVATLRSAKLSVNGSPVWASLDLPPLIRAKKVFMLGLRWQLGQWGFVKRDIVISEDYSNMSIGEKVILKFTSCVDGLLKLEWSDEWANWAEFQSSAEVQQLADRANAILEKQAKGVGKGKSKQKV